MVEDDDSPRALSNNPDVYLAMPFGLIGQWLQFEQWQRSDSSFGRDISIGLNDWDGRWSMLHWVTEQIVEDHAVASQHPRNYMQDVSLEHHLTFWFMTARLCYDTIAYIAVQLMAAPDRGKLSSLSFHTLSTAKERPAFQKVTNELLKIVKEATEAFDELRTIRDNMVHFVGRSGNKVEPPKRVWIDFANTEGVNFSLEVHRFADLYGSVEKWPVQETLRKHFRILYEVAGQLECCFLDHTAKEKLPGAFRYMRRTMADFLDANAFEEFSHPKWLKSAQDIP